jgi:hypothetical protein
MTGPKKPRASISVTLLEDADFVAMMASGESGLRAVAVFMLLIVKAKALGNNGVFRQPIAVIAAMIRTSEDAVRSAISCINSACEANRSSPWVVLNQDGSLVIPRFSKWNSEHGGAREGAGRPPSKDQVGIQDGGGDEPAGNQDDSSDPVESILIPPLYVETERNGTERSASERTATNRVQEKPTKAREPDPIWDAVAARYFGGKVPRPQTARVGKVVRDLRDMDAQPSEIPRRADRIVREWGEGADTPESLVKHWTKFDHDQTPKQNGAANGIHARDARRAEIASRNCPDPRGERPIPFITID